MVTIIDFKICINETIKKEEEEKNILLLINNYLLI